MSDESLQPNEHLVEAIEKQLEFTRQGEWLVQDDFNRVGGGDLYEWLPTRFRISTSGDRYEIGVRREDIKGLFELTRTIGKNPSPVESILTFWDEPSSHKFSTHEENEWIFMGVNIEPTVDDFQKEYSPLLFAYTLALRAAIEGQTYEELVQSEWQAGLAKHAIDPGTQRTVLFGQLDHLFESLDSCPTCIPIESPKRYVDHLADLSLLEDVFVLKYAPGTARMDDQAIELKEILLEAYNGYREIEILPLHSKDANLRIKLQIPPDISVTTMKDIEQLEVAEIKTYIDGHSNERVTSVNVTVEEDMIMIVTEDARFSLEIKTPKCEQCGIPNWQFPKEGTEKVSDLYDSGLFYLNSSLGIHRYFATFQEDQHCYCANCIGGVVEDYLNEQEYANEAYATQKVEAELRDIGYGDVLIYSAGRDLTKNGWTFETAVEYMRADREITRFTGDVGIDDQGNFTSNLQPREFVLFRYGN